MKSSVFVEMIYMLPEHDKLVQVMMFKLKDEFPECPRSKIFVDLMKDNIEGKIINYRVFLENEKDKVIYQDALDALDNIDKPVTIH